MSEDGWTSRTRLLPAASCWRLNERPEPDSGPETNATSSEQSRCASPERAGPALERRGAQAGPSGRRAASVASEVNKERNSAGQIRRNGRPMECWKVVIALRIPYCNLYSVWRVTDFRRSVHYRRIVASTDGQADFCRWRFFRWISNSETVEGVTPSSRDAEPKVAGRA